MLKKACDTCHLRRVKCSGVKPCGRCVRVGVECTFLAVPQKKGPKRKRTSAPSQPPPIIRRDSGSASAARDPASAQDSPEPASVSLQDLITMIGRASSREQHSKSGLLNVLTPMLAPCLETYLSNIYPLVPIVDPERIRTRFSLRDHLYDPQFGALVLAMACNAALSQDNWDHSQSDGLMQMALELHASTSMGEEPASLETISTAMIMGGYMRARQRVVAAHIRTREAITIAEVLNLHHPATYQRFSAAERELALIIYWKLAVAERSNSLIHQSQITFKGEAFPLASAGIFSSPFLARLAPITRVFDTIRAENVDCINGRCARPFCLFDRTHAVQMAASLEDTKDYQGLSQVQTVDVEVTRLWLCAKLWQTCVSHGLLEANPIEPILDIQYPLTILQDTIRVIEKHPESAFKGNGQCMVSPQPAMYRTLDLTKQSLKLGNIADTVELVLSASVLDEHSTADSSPTSILERIRIQAIDLSQCKWMRSER